GVLPDGAPWRRGPRPQSTPAPVPRGGHPRGPGGAGVQGDRPSRRVAHRHRDVAALARAGTLATDTRSVRAGARLRQGVRMNCVAFERHLHAYVDGELAVSEMLAAEADRKSVV